MASAKQPKVIGGSLVTGGSLVATVSGESQEYDCTVSVYSDPNCSDDAQAAAVNGTCTTFPFTFESYSVDCISVNGSTTIVDGSSGSSTGDSDNNPETSTPSTELTLQRVQATAAGSTTSTTPLLPSSPTTFSSPQNSAQPISTSSTTKASTSSPIPITESNILMNTASTPTTDTTSSSNTTSPTSSNDSTNFKSNSNTDLGRNDQIVIGVVIPCVAIIVAVLIGIYQRRRFKDGRGMVFNTYNNYYGNSTRSPSVAPSGVDSSTSRPMSDTDVDLANRDP